MASRMGRNDRRGSERASGPDPLPPIADSCRVGDKIALLVGAVDGGPDAASRVVGQLMVLVGDFVGFVETVESVSELRLTGNTRVGRGGDCGHDGHEDTKDAVPSRGGVQTGRSLDERWKVGIAMQDIRNKLGPGEDHVQPAGICMISRVNEATGPGNGIEAGIIYTGR